MCFGKQSTVQSQFARVVLHFMFNWSHLLSAVVFMFPLNIHSQGATKRNTFLQYSVSVIPAPESPKQQNLTAVYYFCGDILRGLSCETFNAFFYSSFLLRNFKIRIQISLSELIRSLELKEALLPSVCSVIVTVFV